MRRLIHIPIVHGGADLGSQEERVRQAYHERGGEAAWAASRDALAEFWRALEAGINALRLDWSKVRLYQDGLPVCGFEERIVRDLAGQGTANYRILADLVSRGARLEGTEDPDLLRQEYELILTDAVVSGAANNTQAAALADLLQRRDDFIARRIGATLLDGETGLLFLGALHRAAERLPATISVMGLRQALCGGV